MAAKAYAKDGTFTAGSTETAREPAASGDLIGATSAGDEPAALPGSYKIGTAGAANVYAQGA